jgi:hypothetical protein
MLQVCKDLGYLTQAPLYSHPITPVHLSYVLKAYATESHLPFEATEDVMDALASERLYLTPEGWAWLFNFFQSKSYTYLRTYFISIYNLSTSESDVADPMFSGYRAYFGGKPTFNKKGSGQRAFVIQQKGKFKKRYEYTTLHEAREAILMLSRFYPISDFKLYRYAKVREAYYPREVPIYKKGVPL